MDWVLALSILAVILFVIHAIYSFQGSSPSKRSTSNLKSASIKSRAVSTDHDQFKSELTGVAVYNKDGTNRQKLIRDLKKGDELKLRLDSSREDKAPAIAVLGPSNQKIGYVDEVTSRILIPRLRQDIPFKVVVDRIKSAPRTSVKDVVVSIEKKAT